MTSDPRTLFILEVTVCAVLPNSPCFPPLPSAPGNHFSTVSMSWMIPHRKDTCGIFMSFFLMIRKLKLPCGGDRTAIVNWPLALVSPWLALCTSFWLFSYDLFTFLLDCNVLDIGFVSPQAPFPIPAPTFVTPKHLINWG